MAEQDPTPEQLAAIAAANEQAEGGVNYKPPAQKSLQEIQELDKDDESLRKYKEALLGNAAAAAGLCCCSNYTHCRDTYTLQTHSCNLDTPALQTVSLSPSRPD